MNAAIISCDNNNYDVVSPVGIYNNKTLWRKIVSTGNLNAGSAKSVDATLSGKTVVNVEGSLYQSDNATVAINHYYDPNQYSVTYVSNGNLMVKSSVAVTSGVAIIYYTD